MGFVKTVNEGAFSSFKCLEVCDLQFCSFQLDPILAVRQLNSIFSYFVKFPIQPLSYFHVDQSSVDKLSYNLSFDYLLVALKGLDAAYLNCFDLFIDSLFGKFQVYLSSQSACSPPFPHVIPVYLTCWKLYQGHS